MPTFSIVIPTRARADTLQHTLKTVLNQTFTDIEVIVHESGADPATAKLLAGISDPRLRFWSTGEPVPMTENWERALDHVRGDYVMYVGDDDGLLPDSCMLAKYFFDSGAADVLTSLRAVYYWPGYGDPQWRNRLEAQYGTTLKFTIKDTHAHLATIFRFEEIFVRLPMLYYSFVSRRLIDQIRAARGRYFFGAAPDVISGIVNCHFTGRFALCNRPIALGGASHHSTGYRAGQSGDSAARDEASKAAFGEMKIHPTMANSVSRSLTLAVGNEYLLAKEELFPFKPPAIDYTAMLSRAAREINNVPGWYESISEEILWIAARNNVPSESIAIPPRISSREPPQDRKCLGVREVVPGIVTVDLDGSALGIMNVFDASLYFERILPVFRSAPEIIIEPVRAE